VSGLLDYNWMSHQWRWGDKEEDMACEREKGDDRKRGQITLESKTE
jgi:hypothetical protein